MLKEGLILMVVGMGTVYVFLIIMIYVMMVMEKLVIYLNKIMPEKVAETVKTVSNKKNGNQEVAVAIAAVRALK